MEYEIPGVTDSGSTGFMTSREYGIPGVREFVVQDFRSMRVRGLDFGTIRKVCKLEDSGFKGFLPEFLSTRVRARRKLVFIEAVSTAWIPVNPVFQSQVSGSIRGRKSPGVLESKNFIASDRYSTDWDSIV